MKRLAVGIALAFLPNCIQANPVAEEQKSAEETLRDSIGPFCDDICQRGSACQLELGDDCPGNCREYMAVFVDNGAECVTHGQSFESCATSLQSCEELGGLDDCDPNGEAHYLCLSIENPVAPTVDRAVFCQDGGGTSAGKAPTASDQTPQTVSCDTFYEGCSDGASYRVNCHQYEGVLVCNCFRDGIVTGVAFTPASGDCPSDFDEINPHCGWTLQY